MCLMACLSLFDCSNKSQPRLAYYAAKSGSLVCAQRRVLQVHPHFELLQAACYSRQFPCCQSLLLLCAILSILHCVSMTSWVDLPVHVEVHAVKVSACKTCFQEQA